MRVLVLARLKGGYDDPIQLKQLLQGVYDWEKHHASAVESFHFFVGGRGGAAVINAADERSLNTVVMAWDFLVLSDLEFQPLVDMRMMVKEPAGGDMPIS